jgi:glutathione S-transferase
LWRIAKNTFLYPEDKRQPTDVALAREEFVEMARVLDRHLDKRNFIVGDRISAADCVTAYLLDWAGEIGLLRELPNLRDYLERMYRRPTAPPRIAAASPAKPA